jgi:hypothetical protein
MTRSIRHLLLCGALVAFVTGVACHRHKGGAPAGKLDGLAKTALDVLPEGTSILAGVSWTKLHESPFYAKALAHFATEEGEVHDWIDLVKQLCQIDLVTAADSAVVAMPETFEAKNLAVFLKGKWEEAQVDKCIVAIADKGAGVKLTASKDGKLTHYAATVGDKRVSIWIAWVAPDTILFTTGGLAGDRGQLDGILATTSHASGDKALKGILEHVDTTATAWAAIVKPPNADDAASFFGLTSGGQIDGIYASAQLDAGLSGWVGFRFDSEKSASKAVKKAAQELKGLADDPRYAKVAAGAKVAAYGRDVVTKGEVPSSAIDEQADKLAKMSVDDVVKLVNQLSSGSQEDQQ